MRIDAPAEQRFRSGVLVAGPDECWLWQRSCTKAGYGQIMVDGAMRYAHRVAYALHKGSLPRDQLVCHTCDERRCCNPKHLFLGDATANMRDMAAKGRQWMQRDPSRVRGSANNAAKLTEDNVRSIRERRGSGEATRALAREFGVSQQAIQNVVKGVTWSHL